MSGRLSALAFAASLAVGAGASAGLAALSGPHNAPSASVMATNHYRYTYQCRTEVVGAYRVTDCHDHAGQHFERFTLLGGRP